MLYSKMSAVFQRWQGDLTYSDIARLTGMSVSGVSEAIRGVVLPRAETVAVLCAAFGRTEQELIQAIADEASP